MANFCSKCGNAVADGQRFCSKCGNVMNAAPAQNAAPVQNVAPVRTIAPVSEKVVKNYLITTGLYILFTLFYFVPTMTIGGGEYSLAFAFNSEHIMDMMFMNIICILFAVVGLGSLVVPFLTKDFGNKAFTLIAGVVAVWNVVWYLLALVITSFSDEMKNILVAPILEGVVYIALGVAVAYLCFKTYKELK